MGEKGPALYASNCSPARTSLYLFNISPHQPSNKGKCQAQEAEPHSEHRHNGRHPSVPSHVPPPGFSVPPGAGAVERGPVLTAPTSLPAVYFLSDCKTPPLQGVFCVVSFLQTPRVKRQLAGSWKSTTCLSSSSRSRSRTPGLGRLHAPSPACAEYRPVLGWEVPPTSETTPCCSKKLLCPRKDYG